MQVKHSEKWKKYIQVQNFRGLNPQALSAFSKLIRLDGVWYKKFAVDGELQYFIDKGIV